MSVLEGSVLENAWRVFTERNIQLRSLKVAVLVGAVLNLINQGAEILLFEANLMKIGLTFCVPYCVASYGAVSARLEKGRAEVGRADVGRADVGRADAGAPSGDRGPQ